MHTAKHTEANSEGDQLDSFFSITLKDLKKNQELSGDIYSALVRSMIGECCRQRIDLDSCKEIVHDIFVELLSILDDEIREPRKKVVNWLFFYLDKRIIDHHRKQQRQRTQPVSSLADDERNIENYYPDTTRQPSEIAEKKEYYQQLEYHLNQLTKKLKPKHKKISELFFRHEWPQNKIARELKTSESTVNRVVNGVRREIEKRLKEEGFVLDES